MGGIRHTPRIAKVSILFSLSRHFLCFFQPGLFDLSLRAQKRLQLELGTSLAISQNQVKRSSSFRERSRESPWGFYPPHPQGLFSFLRPFLRSRFFDLPSRRASATGFLRTCFCTRLVAPKLKSPLPDLAMHKKWTPKRYIRSKKTHKLDTSGCAQSIQVDIL